LGLGQAQHAPRSGERRRRDARAPLYLLGAVDRAEHPLDPQQHEPIIGDRPVELLRGEALRGEPLQERASLLALGRREAFEPFLPDRGLVVHGTILTVRIPCSTAPPIARRCPR
jgi:hypothetical protein